MNRPSSARIVSLLAIVLVVAACSSAAAPTTTPTGPGATPTPVPGAPGAGGSGGSGGGANPGGPVGNPLDDAATFVVPQPGQLDRHAVNVQLLRATADGRHVQVELRWWSGVPPCSVLDSVTVDRSDDAKTIVLTAIEGAGAKGVACIDIAQLTATVVDLGDLPAGRWTISAAGDAAPVEIDLS